MLVILGLKTAWSTLGIFGKNINAGSSGEYLQNGLILNAWSTLGIFEK